MGVTSRFLLVSVFAKRPLTCEHLLITTYYSDEDQLGRGIAAAGKVGLGGTWGGGITALVVGTVIVVRAYLVKNARVV